jgi:type III secretory pathway component EscU
MIVNIIIILLILYVVFFILDLCGARAAGIREVDMKYAADRMYREMKYKEWAAEKRKDMPK